MIAFAVGFAVGVALTLAGYFLGRKHGETRAYLEMHREKALPPQLHPVFLPLEQTKPLFPSRERD